MPIPLKLQPLLEGDRYYLRSSAPCGFDAAGIGSSGAAAIRERFAELFLADSDWFWETDSDWRMTLISERFLKLTGHPAEAAIGRSLAELGFHPENETDAGALQRLRGRHKPYRGLVWTGTRPDGGQFWFRSGGVPVFDTAGAFAGYRGVGSDLSELYETRAQLLSSEARLRDFAASASEWFWEADREFRITSMSETFYEISGYQPGQMLGLTRNDFGFACASADDEARLRSAIRRREPIRGVVANCSVADGSKMWIRLGGVPTFDAAGKFTGYRGSGTDLTPLYRAQQELRQREARFQDLAESTSDWFWEVGPDLRFTYISERIVDYTGQTAAWHIGKLMRFSGEFPEERSQWQQHMLDLEQGRAFRGFCFRRRHPDGHEQWFSISGKPFHAADGSFAGYRGSGAEVTAARRVEVALQTSEASMRAILDTVLDSIIVIDDGGIIQSINPAVERLFQYSAADLLGRNVKMLMPPDVAMAHDGYLADYLRTGEAKVIGIGREIVAQRADGSRFPAELSVTGFQVNGRRLFTGMVRDISERKQTEARLKELATTDPLTGLANRRHLDDLAATEFGRWRRHGTPLSLAMLDIDHFKPINDTHGHAAGDSVLVALAEICRQAVRDIDSVTRIGGEEFVILLPSSDIDGAVRVAERIRQNVEAAPIQTEQGPIAVRVSLGVASAGEGRSDLATLTAAADAGLYQAKQTGRNRVCRA